jgi:large subunit ribosomal protein L18
MGIEKKIEKRLQRKRRIRSRVVGLPERPRLSIFRSNKHIFAQVIDDSKAVTIVSVSDSELGKKEPGKTKKTFAFLAGESIAKKALAKKVKKVVFDRGGYRYHGRVKEFADGARKGGLEF